MHSLLTSLKAAEQDFEFYPTNAEIIAAMVRDMKRIEHNDAGDGRRYRSRRSYGSVLDIGAGNGKVLQALQKAFTDKDGRQEAFGELYAIEKSPILCGQLGADVFVVGTEFEQQSLLSKQVDVIFSNPPYSIFDQWTVKIIRESAAPLVYLVIPERWKASGPIADALKYRGAKTKVVGEFTFEHAEDRQARAKVHLLRVELQEDKDDAFERFFNEQFGGLREKFAASEKPEGETAGEADPRFSSLVVGENYPAAMVALYTQEMAHIQRNYEAVALLDVALLKEFNIDPKSIMKCLKERLTGLRNVYWKELFSRMGAITDRLTGKKRGLMLETLNRHCHVDFTVDNIHAVIVWVLKNANDYLDSQLIETFEQMVEKANVKNYESNRRAFEWDRWRYNSGERATHFALEYRIVLQSVGGISNGGWSRKGLDETAANFFGDLLTVARNIGFLCNTGDYRLSYRERKDWQSNKLETFYFTNATTHQREVLFEVRAFKNRNCHVRMHQRLALALNVEYGRLKGWLKSGEEASVELNDPEAAGCFKTNLCLPTGGDPMLLLGEMAA